MRYELRLTAYDVIDQVHVTAALYGTSGYPFEPSELVWARTATCRSRGTPEATEWTREVLNTMLEAL